MSLAMLMTEAAVLRNGCLRRSLAVARCSGFRTRQQERKSRRSGETCQRENDNTQIKDTLGWSTVRELH